MLWVICYRVGEKTDVGWVDGWGLVNEELRGDVKIFS